MFIIISKSFTLKSAKAFFVTPLFKFKGGVCMKKKDEKSKEEKAKKKSSSFTTKYDPDRLRELIEQGRTAKEIMKELGIARYTLNEHLLMLQRKDKKVYHIDGLFDYTDEKRQRNKVRKHDGILIPPSLIEKSALNPGDKYEILVEKGHVVLKKVEDDE